MSRTFSVPSSTKETAPIWMPIVGAVAAAWESVGTARAAVVPAATFRKSRRFRSGMSMGLPSFDSERVLYHGAGWVSCTRNALRPDTPWAGPTARGGCPHVIYLSPNGSKLHHGSSEIIRGRSWRLHARVEGEARFDHWRG